jgi:outer membrane protein assembly factor BamB
VNVDPSSRSRQLASWAPAVLTALVLGACGSAGSATSAAPKQTRPPGFQRTLGPAGAAAGGPLAPQRGGWSTLLAGASHFGLARSEGPQNARVRWKRTLEGPIVQGPVTRADVAYVSSAKGVLHAIDIASGADLWTYDGGAGAGTADLSTSPTVLADGTILFPAGADRLVALDPSGHVLWSITGSAQPLTPAVEEARRLLVIADTRGTVSGYRLGRGDAPPVRLWTRALSAESFGNPALGSDGTSYVTAGHVLVAIAADGALRWQVKIAQTIETGAALAEDGTVVFGGNDQIEYGIGPDGALRWRHPIGNFTYSTPLALPGDLVVYGNHSGEMTTLDARDGQPVRVDRGSGQIWTAAAVDGRGDVYFASRSGIIFGFAATGRRLFEIAAGGTFDSYPAIAADGTLLVGGDDGVLRAIG